MPEKRLQEELVIIITIRRGRSSFNYSVSVTCSCVFVHLFFQREEIICCLAELLTEKKDEILSANKRDMELATASGINAELWQHLLRFH